jgi:ParB family transcriptional regulator, chromosome partitioning protein
MVRKPLSSTIQQFIRTGEMEINSESALAIEVSLIDFTDLQYRKYYNPEEVQAMGLSLQERQIQPIMVRPAGDRYQLVCGQKRVLGCRAIGKTTIQAVVEDLSDEEVVQIALTENLHRSSPNPIEETIGILALLTLRTQKSREELTALFNLASRGSNNPSADNVIRSPEWQVIKSTLNGFGFTPETFRVNRLRLLNIPDEVREAVEQGKLEYTKALAIAKVKDPGQREKLLAQAIEQGLTLQIIQMQIKAASSSTPPTVATDKQRLKALTQQVTRSTIWQSPSRLQKLQKLMTEIEELLN